MTYPRLNSIAVAMLASFALRRRLSAGRSRGDRLQGRHPEALRRQVTHCGWSRSDAATVQQSSTRWIAGLALAGMLIPLGILSEGVLGVPPLLANVGGISMVAAVAWLGMFGWRLDLTQGGRP